MILRNLALAPALLALSLSATAQRASSQATPAETPAPAAAASNTAPKPADSAKPKLDPLSADKSVPQTITVNGKVLHYTATVGTVTLKASDDKPTGDITYIAYVLDTPKDQPHNRPITFALNGGPGASSVYLNLGAIGPRHIPFANEGDSPSDPAILSDNPNTWLDFTDLVFIDPIGTGFSRSLVDEVETKKLFYAPTPDVQYLSLVIYKWLVKNDRLLDKKYLIGESYGGYRGPRMAYYLQGTLGVAMNGVVLVSPYLNPQFGDKNLSPIPWMTTLPPIAAAHLEAQGKLTDAAIDTSTIGVRKTKRNATPRARRGTRGMATNPIAATSVEARTGATFTSHSGPFGSLIAVNPKAK